MIWSNLFSVESKFKITLKTSKIQAWFSFFGFVFLSLFVSYITYLSLHQLVDAPYQPFIILFFCYTAYLYHNHVVKFTSTVLGVFEIDYNGYCVFSVGEKYLITTSSRIGWYSCHLFLLCDDEKSKQLYIYKDACSRSDYARICRVIKKQLTSNR